MSEPIDKREVGVYRKFEVRRLDGNDGPGKKHDDCAYFVLDLTHDPYALDAAEAYADACEGEYPVLAADLRETVALFRSKLREDRV